MAVLKVTREVARKIVYLRRTRHFSYRQVAGETGIGKDTVKKHCWRLIPEYERMMKKKFSHLQNRVKVTKHAPVHEGSVEYDFLRNIRIVFKFIEKKYELSRTDLETILYLYPLGVFTREKYREYTIVFDPKTTASFGRLTSKGFIVLFRPYTPFEKPTYILSKEAKTMCKEMHKMCISPEKMKKGKGNPFDPTVKTDKKYLDLIMKIRRAERARESEEEQQQELN